ncbi:hypothetical protein [Geobacillus kaustophilus]|uniref:Hypothetical conserved protein n=1 Tax=Geobacillus kaustophilus (strain HTA426) TaxID=235909 RepID=Q5L2J1_GEOKA|nr:MULTISPECIES: hypothetical protein [Geobacillus thermoleovorans group]MBW7642399.1 hypothetical protein [Geobacillus thermoleovorans]BAD74839.1 hypothetical conserved protein [Geobacillus kaustophilus HTA426]
MPLTKRDKAIIADLQRFRVMSRDDIAEIHFKGLKRPQESANNVLLRLVRDGHIQRSTAFIPYVYFCAESNIKKNSQKIPHYLEIVKTYKEILSFSPIETFVVEPKYKKGLAEPDAFFIYQRTPFFLECQRSIYSEKIIEEKLNRYLALYESGIIAGEPWQPAGKVVFPYVLIISDTRYALNRQYPFRVFQAQSFSNFLRSLKQPQQPQQPYSDIKVAGARLKLRDQ